MAQMLKEPKIMKFYLCVGKDSDITYHAETNEQLLDLIPKCTTETNLQKINPFNNEPILGDCRTTDLVPITSLSQLEREMIIAYGDSRLQTQIILSYFESLNPEMEETIDEPPKVNEPIPDNNDSRLAQDLLDTVDKINAAWTENMITQPVDEWSRLEKEEKRRHYLQEVAPLQGFEIIQIIDAMIMFEDYPMSAFQGFESLKKIINDQHTTPLDRAKAVRQLAMMGASKVMGRININRAKSLIPISSTQFAGAENIEERKVIRE